MGQQGPGIAPGRGLLQGAAPETRAERILQQGVLTSNKPASGFLPLPATRLGSNHGKVRFP